jgi:hypothetical protein
MALAQALTLPRDFDAPMAESGRNLIADFGPLDAAVLPPSGETLVDPAGEAPARPPMIAGNASICRSSA